MEGACKLLLAVRFFPQVGQDPTLSPCKELPNYSVCMVLWAPHQHTLPFGTSYFLLGRIKIIASQMALYGGISLLASAVVQPVCLFASKQTLGELREVNILAFLIACNAVARGFMKNKLPQEERHLLHYMCSASSHYSSSIQSSLCVCSRRFLEAFFSVKAQVLVFAMCISYAFLQPHYVGWSAYWFTAAFTVALYNKII